MKTLKKIITSPVFSIAAVAVAAGLLIFASISGARAVLNVESDDYFAHVELNDIGVTLNENGVRVAWRDYDTEKADGSWDETPGENHIGTLCANLLGEDEVLKLGKKYTEALSVTNAGSVDEFVRVTIYRYWLDPKGNKTLEPDPGMIDLHLITGDWLLDKDSSTKERTVLYYSKMLGTTDETKTTTPLSDTVMISDEIATLVEQDETVSTMNGKKYTTIKTTYIYDGYQFVLEAEVDAVQAHNAADAVKSAWGKNVVISGSTLSLK